jgi:sec-independent protein translocase protein TatA
MNFIDLFNDTNLLFSMPGGGEWIFIIIAILLLFGGKKIPELMRGVGKGMREFKDAKDNVKSEIELGMKEKDMSVNSTTAEEIRLQELKLQQLKEQQARLQS